MSDEEHPGEPWLALDTSLEAARVQAAIFQRMTGEQRVKMAFEMSEAARRAALAGVRQRHPEYTPRQVQLAVYRMELGEELFHLAFPGNEDVRP